MCSAHPGRQDPASASTGRNRPDPDRIRRGLFPSVLAIASDDRGFRIIGREPLPFVAIAGEASYHYSWTAGWRGFLPHFEESFSLTFPRFDWDD